MPGQARRAPHPYGTWLQLVRQELRQRRAEAATEEEPLGDLRSLP